MAQLRVYYFVFFGALGLQVPFLPVYLHTLGLNQTQLPLVMSIIPLVKMISPVALGPLADLLGQRRKLILVLVPISILGFVFMGWRGLGVPIAVGMVVFAMGRASLIPLMDSLAVDIAREQGGHFAHVRVFGSAGFLVVVLLGGWWMKGAMSSGVFPVKAYFPLLLGALGVVFLSAMFLPARRYTPPASFLGDIGRLLSMPPLRRTYLALVFYGVGWETFFTFFSLRVQELGGDTFHIALNHLPGVVMEMLVVLLAPRWFEKRDVAKFIGPAMLVGAVRWALIGWVDHLWWLMAVQLLHGLGFGLFYVAVVDLVQNHSPPGVRSSAQALISFTNFGLGAWLGGLLMSALSGAGFGIHHLFYVAGGFGLVASFIVWQAASLKEHHSVKGFGG